MKITIEKLKELGQKAEMTGDAATALKILWRLVDASPQDIENRLKIADLLSKTGSKDVAAEVYKAVAIYGIKSGHPLISLVTIKILEESGHETGPILQMLAEYYSSSSTKISAKGQRLSPEHPDTEIQPPDLEAEISYESVIAGAARAAANLDTVTEYPSNLHRIPLLSDLPPETFMRLCGSIKAIRVPDNAAIIREGEMGRSFFFLAMGQVRVFHADRHGHEKTLATLGEGALFGEMALIHASPRTASVMSSGYADLLEIDSAGLSTMASNLQSVAQALDHFTRDRLLNNLMATSPLFAPFSKKQRLDLLRRFSGHEVPPETVVIREGDEGRGLYVVLSGEVEITKDHEGGQILLATLKAGDVFGEISLIKGFPATASVKAVRRSTILFLDRVYFMRLVEALPEIKSFFENTAEERLHDTRSVLSDDDGIEISDEMILI